MTDLLPCPICGGTETRIEPQGMIWRGVRGYSDPQWYRLQHFGRLTDDDDFPRCYVDLRCRTAEQATGIWNNLPR